MTRLSALLALSLVALPATAMAQDSEEESVNTLIIYGEDECPQSTANQITVCARMDEGERFRIPQNLRESTSPANEAWANRVKSFETVGDFGTMSCSPVGAGGEFGCTPKFIEAAYAERAQGDSVRFSQLIAEARAERLSTIDAEAAETQARVEVLEQQYMERERQRQAAAAEANDADLPTPGN